MFNIRLVFVNKTTSLIFCLKRVLIIILFNFRVSATYTSPSLGVQNVVNASTYPQMIGLSAEQVHALMPQQSSATLLPHSQRHTPPQHTAAAPHAAKYPPPLIPVNNSTSANSSNSNNDTTNSRYDTMPEEITID